MNVYFAKIKYIEDEKHIDIRYYPTIFKPLQEVINILIINYVKKIKIRYLKLYF